MISPGFVSNRGPKTVLNSLFLQMPENATPLMYAEKRAAIPIGKRVTE
jgi:hypothetical protein